MVDENYPIRLDVLTPVKHDIYEGTSKLTNPKWYVEGGILHVIHANKSILYFPRYCLKLVAENYTPDA